MGDIVLASGLPCAIKEADPNSLVVFIYGSDYNGIFDYNPNVDITLKYEKTSRLTEPSLEKLPKLLKDAITNKSLEESEELLLTVADLQNNSRSESLSYNLKDIFKDEEWTNTKLFITYSFLEKYRSAKLMMVYGKNLPLFLIKMLSTKNKENVFSDLDDGYDIDQIKGERSYRVRKLLEMPSVIFRYKNTVWTKDELIKGLPRPRIWTEYDKKNGVYCNNYDSIENLERRRLIAIFPGAAHKNKKYPLELVSKLCQLIIEGGDNVILIGGPAEKDEIKSIELSLSSFVGGEEKRLKTLISTGNIQDTTKAVDNADIIISNDSAGAHIGVARKKKTIVFYGSTVPELGFSYNDSSYKVIENNNLSCRPCTHIGSNDCPRADFACLNTIRPESVYRDIREWLFS
ncbi:MAG: hypothetical protein Kapaf2KO_04340 [Candidatus Kapaibacteriales bacterium]